MKYGTKFVAGEDIKFGAHVAGSEADGKLYTTRNKYDGVALADMKKGTTAYYDGVGGYKVDWASPATD